MTGRLENRLVRLEQRSASSWQAFVGIPLDRWPDEALEAYIRDRSGLEPQTVLTDKLLLSFIATAKAAAAE